MTPRELIQMAYGELGFASYAFDMQAEQYAVARMTLDAMISEWEDFATGYLPAAGLDDPSGVEARFNSAVYANLAVRLAPSVGKEAAPRTQLAAKMGREALAAASVTIPNRGVRLGSVPSGAGAGQNATIGWEGE